MIRENKVYAIVSVLIVFSLTISLNGCRSKKPLPTDSDVTNANSITVAERIERIGISVPIDSMRIDKDSAEILRLLESKGYSVNLLYANSIEAQYSHISDLISSGCDLLFVSPVNEYVLGNALENAKVKNIPVIALDKMILFSDAVDYYLAYDNAGNLHGDYLVKQLNLNTASEAVNIEIFPGDLITGDASFYNNLILTLEKYISSESVRILSDQFSPDEMSVSETEYTASKARMEKLIAANNYFPGGTALDAVLCKNDIIAMGVIEALKAAGFTSENFPIVTGGACDPTNIKYIQEGYQSMSLFLDPAELGKKAVELVDSISNGKKLDSNNSIAVESHEIPAYLCEPIICTNQNYQRLLLDSGYYDALDLY